MDLRWIHAADCASELASAAAELVTVPGELVPGCAASVFALLARCGHRPEGIVPMAGVGDTSSFYCPPFVDSGSVLASSGASQAARG